MPPATDAPFSRNGQNSCSLPSALSKALFGALHSHPHTQVSYVAEGSFDVTVDGVTTRLSAGASFIVAPNLVHGVVALEKGLLIDTFTPRRDDFISQP